MTTEEWRSKSNDWRAGYRACQEAADIPAEYSDEWKAGYIYGLEHPFGPVAVPQ